jgi:hypothetical protein
MTCSVGTTAVRARAPRVVADASRHAACLLDAYAIVARRERVVDLINRRLID